MSKFIAAVPNRPCPFCGSNRRRVIPACWRCRHRCRAPRQQACISVAATSMAAASWTTSVLEICQSRKIRSLYGLSPEGSRCHARSLAFGETSVQRSRGCGQQQSQPPGGEHSHPTNAFGASNKSRSKNRLHGFRTASRPSQQSPGMKQQHVSSSAFTMCQSHAYAWRRPARTTRESGTPLPVYRKEFGRRDTQATCKLRYGNVVSCNQWVPICRTKITVTVNTGYLAAPRSRTKILVL